MVYSKEFSVDSFEFWSGAKDTVEDVRKAEKMDELQSLIEEQFSDFVWFERGYIYSQLGLDENGKLPDEDEDEA